MIFLRTLTRESIRDSFRLCVCGGRGWGGGGECVYSCKEMPVANGTYKFSILSFRYLMLKILGKYGPVLNACILFVLPFPSPQTIQFNNYSHCTNTVVTTQRWFKSMHRICGNTVSLSMEALSIIVFISTESPGTSHLHGMCVLIIYIYMHLIFN